MTRPGRRLAGVTLIVAATATAAMPAPTAQPVDPVVYTVTFPEPEHHWLQVEALFPSVEPGSFRVRMSRSSPGRYAIHEFAKNVFHLEAYGRSGQRLATRRTDPDEWLVDDHGGAVRLVYRVFGDQVDGTYLAVDTTHAHLNMPAVFMWGVGLDAHPIRIRFVPPPDSNWRVATQLFSTPDPFSYTAPNLQYFMDSPTELSDFLASSFVATAGGREARIQLVAHADAAARDLAALARLVERLVREQAAVFGELPLFDTGTYTFLLDYLPWAGYDGMEHRNSTVISDPGVSLTTPEGRADALGTIAHEFFHAWNGERLRPAGLEPFDFTRANVTCCLWFAEGFTEYYATLLLRRAGLSLQPPVGFAVALMTGAGRAVRSAVEMSEHAPFADGATAADVHDRHRTFVSYYSGGAALALALDLSLRDRSGSALSLDDFMRHLWRQFGAAGGARPGYVVRPYTLGDLRRELALFTRDQAFADEFFDRHVEGRDAPDFDRLLGLAGYAAVPIAPGRSSAGDVRVREVPGGLQLAMGWPVPFSAPVYAAGLDQGDEIVSIDGGPATLARWIALGEKPPGSRVILEARRRDGSPVSTVIVLQPDISLRVVDQVELTPRQQAFRDAWLASRAGGGPADGSSLANHLAAPNVSSGAGAGGQI